jgi:hypothetical protein
MLPRFRTIVAVFLLVAAGESGCASYYDWAYDSRSSGWLPPADYDWARAFGHAIQGLHN